MSEPLSAEKNAASLLGGARGEKAVLAPVDRRILVVAAAVFAVLMAFSARYGFDRDELYFLDCARHLSLSYVDQPIFTPLVARLSLDLFGVSRTGLRLWPSLAAAGTVVIGGLLAREFGGGRMAQLAAALGVATAPALPGADHIMGHRGPGHRSRSVVAGPARWATFAMTRALAQDNGGLANAVTFIVSQLFMAAPVLIAVWITGPRHDHHRCRARPAEGRRRPASRRAASRLHPRPDRRGPRQPRARDQPGTGRARLPLQRPGPTLGSALADISPLRLTSR